LLYITISPFHTIYMYVSLFVFILGRFTQCTQEKKKREREREHIVDFAIFLKK